MLLGHAPGPQAALRRFAVAAGTLALAALAATGGPEPPPPMAGRSPGRGDGGACRSGKNNRESEILHEMVTG